MTEPEGIDLGDFTPPVVPEAQPTAFTRRRQLVASALARHRRSLLTAAGVIVAGTVAGILSASGIFAASDGGPPAADPALPGSTSTPYEIPTVPPLAEPTEFAEPAYNDEYGTFEPFTLSGEGSQVVQLPVTLRSYLVTASYSGEAIFSLSPLDASGIETKDIGPFAYESYEGTQSYGVRRAPTDVTAFDVRLSNTGSWTLTFSPVAAAPVLTLPARADGDAVFRYEGPAITLTFAHGDASFIAQTPGEEYIRVEEIDLLTSTVTLRAGRSVVEIYSGGDSWSLTAD